MNLRITHPPADERDVTDLEARIGRRLPEDYRQFLLATNGGSQPSIEEFDIPGEGSGVIQTFYGFYGGYSDLREAIARSADVFPHAIPVAKDLFGNTLLLALTDQYFGRVFWCDHDLLPDGSEAEPILIAQSFTEFLSSFDESSPNTRNV